MSRVGKCARVVFAALMVASFAALAVRIWFIVATGPYAATTGFEEFCHYNIWKAAHGLPLYEWPQKPPFLLTSYNFGFYYTYAAWARIWGALDQHIVLCTRMLTLISMGFACALHVNLSRRAIDPANWMPAWTWGLSFLFWFGSTCGPWTAVTTRPDAAAVALALAGLTFSLRASAQERAGDAFFASLLFFAAWSFKQSVVWIYAGVLIHGLASGASWKRLTLLIVPFAILSGIVIWMGDDAYRYNVFAVPGIYRWFPRQGASVLSLAVILNPFFWLIGAAAVVGYVRCWRPLRSYRTGSPEWHGASYSVIAIPPILCGCIQLALHGSGSNNILEGAALISALAIATWSRWLHEEKRETRLLVGAALLVVVLPFPVFHVLQAARGIPETEIHGVSLGNATKLNSAQLAQRRDFAGWMQSLPKPIWIDDAMLQMPWFATDGKYPAYPFDYQFNADAMMKHVLENRGFISLIRERRFAALLLRPRHDAWFIYAAQAAGYVEAPVPPRFARLATEYGLERIGPRLFLRPAAAGSN